MIKTLVRWIFVTVLMSGIVLADPLPTGWIGADIGVNSPTGTQSYTVATARFDVVGAGADIWGTADQFHYVYQLWTGDGEWIVQVASIQNTNAWAKAGLMVRESTAAGSRYAMLMLTPGNGSALERRKTTDGTSLITRAEEGSTAPGWLKLVRKGDQFDAYTSADGQTWAYWTTDIVTMSANVLVGLAVTSHQVGVLASAVFTQFGATAPLPPDFPSGWTSQDIGSPALSGSGDYQSDGNLLTVRGAGTDIWGTADQFQFAYQSWTGDAVVIARVDSLRNTNAGAKAGVMIRESLAPGSRQATVALTPSSGVAFERRTATGGTSLNTALAGVTIPGWIKLERWGDRFDGFYSTDGLTWKYLGSETIAMSASVYIGLAVTSRNTGVLTEAVFSHFDYHTTGAPGGLWGQYFSGTAFNTPVLQRLDGMVNFTWGTASPAAPAVPADGFSVRWTGSLVADVTQSYTFYTVSDDGVRLWVNNQLLIDNWASHTATENTGTITLTAGTAYAVKMEYYDNTGNAVARLLWSAADRVKAPVAASYLIPSQYPDADADGLPDYWEKLHGLDSANPADATTADPQGNGLTYLQEYLIATHPDSPDTDGDGVPDIADPFPQDFYNGITPILTIVSGDQQSAPVGTFSPAPFDVAVWKADGSGPLIHAPLTFAVTSGGGLLATSNTATAALSASLSAYTDVDGTARIYYQQPTGPGVTSHVTASAGNAQAIFTSTSIAVGDTDGNGLLDSWEIAHFGHVGVDPNADPDGDGLTNLQEFQQGSEPNDYFNGHVPVISIVGGNNQVAVAGQFNSQPFIIRVMDPTGTAPLANAPVSFSVQSGGGQLALTNAGNPVLSGVLSLRTGTDGTTQVWFQQPSLANIVSSISVIVGSAQALLGTTSAAPNQLPVVALTGPANGGSFTIYDNMVLAASASDPDGAIVKVEFYQGADKLGETTTAPYGFTWTNVPAGTYTLKARAYDNGGAYTDSASVSVTVTAPVNPPPQVSLAVYPESAAYPANRQIALVATATESVGGPGGTTKVEFFNGSTKLGETLASLGEGLPDSYELVLPDGLSAGDFQLTARATYADGTMITSDSFNLSIGGVTPWDAHTSFEPAEGFVVGPFSGNTDWQITDGVAQISQNTPFSGQQELVLPAAISSAPAGVALTRVFTGTDQDNVTYLDLRIKPVVSATYGFDHGTHIDTGAGLIAFDYANGQGKLLLATNFDGIGYQGTNYTFPIDSTGAALNWIRITVRHDYTARTWDVYVDGVLISSDRESIDYSSQFSSFSITGATSGAGDTQLDDIYVGPINPLFLDIDNDGMPDSWEIANGLNPLTNDRNEDGAGNGTTNLASYKLGITLPSTDSDRDGLPDVWEIANFGHIGVDSNADPDHDGLTNRQEYLHGTDPNIQDTDGDGMPDGWEVLHGTDPLNDDSAADPDGDGFTNLQEYQRGTDPQDYYNKIIPAVTTLIGSDGSLGDGNVFSVLVTSPDGKSLANAPVTLTVEQGSAQFSLSPQGTDFTTSAVVHTDANGVASVYIKKVEL